MKNTIYLDMDGVLVDFDAEFLARFEMTIEEKDELTAERFWELFNTKSKNFFYDAPPFDNVIDFVGAVHDLAVAHDYNVEILTAVPKLTRHPSAKHEKKEWLKKHNLHHIPFNVGPHAEDKQKHCIAGDILIDDNVMNIVQWNAKGGFGIYHVNFQSSLKYLDTLLSKGIPYLKK